MPPRSCMLVSICPRSTICTLEIRHYHCIPSYGHLGLPVWISSLVSFLDALDVSKRTCQYYINETLADLSSSFSKTCSWKSAGPVRPFVKSFVLHYLQAYCHAQVFFPCAGVLPQVYRVLPQVSTHYRASIVI